MEKFDEFEIYRHIQAFRLMLRAIEDNPNLSVNQALEIAIERKDVPEKLFNYLRRDILGWASAYICSKIFVYLEEIIEENNLDINKFVDTKQYRDAVDKIFAPYPELKNENPLDMYNGIRNAFAHRNLQDNIQKYGHFSIRYYSKSQQKAYQLEISTEQILVFLLTFLNNANLKRISYKSNVDRAKAYYEIDTLDLFIKKLVFRGTDILTKESKRIVLDSSQRKCLKDILLTNDIKKISLNYLISKVLIRPEIKIDELFRQAIMIAIIMQTYPDKPYHELREMNANVMSRLLIRSDDLSVTKFDFKWQRNEETYKYALFDLRPKLFVANMLIISTGALLSDLENKYLLKELATKPALSPHLQGLSEQDMARRCKRIRNSLIHGRYIYDGNLDVYLYDGKDNNHLEYLMKLDLNEFEQLSLDCLNVLEEYLHTHTSNQNENVASGQDESQKQNKDTQADETSGNSKQNIEKPVTETQGASSDIDDEESGRG